MHKCLSTERSSIITSQQVQYSRIQQSLQTNQAQTAISFNEHFQFCIFVTCRKHVPVIPVLGRFCMQDHNVTEKPDNGKKSLNSILCNTADVLARLSSRDVWSVSMRKAFQCVHTCVNMFTDKHVGK